MENQQPEHKILPRITVGRRLLRLFFGAFLMFIIAFTLLFSLLQSPRVQRAGIREMTNWVESRTGSKANITSFNINWKGELVLKDIALHDLEGDTILSARKIHSRVLRDLEGLLRGQLNITDLYIDHGYLRLKNYPEGDNNIDRYLRKLFPPKEDKSNQGQVSLNLKRIRLDDFNFVQVDHKSGKTLDILSGKLLGKLNCIEFSPLQFEFEHIQTTGMEVKVISGTKDTTFFSEIPANQIGKKPKTPYLFTFQSFNISNSRVSIQDGNHLTLPIPGEIQYKNLKISELSIRGKNLTLNQNHHYEVSDLEIALEESSGFSLSSLKAHSVNVSSSGSHFHGLSLQTPHSIVGDSLIFKYGAYTDFLDFNNRVFLETSIKQSEVAISDLLYFAPGLRSVDFFEQNRDLTIMLQGEIGSRINNLRGKGLLLEIGDEFILEGDFSSRNIAVPKEQSLNLKVNNLQTSVPLLNRMIPGLKLPKQFKKLGKLQFSGRFDGFFVDFVADGNLRTNIGAAKMDMRMDLKKGTTNAAYSGNLDLKDFNLGAWSGNKTLGKISVKSKLRNGLGLTAKKARAEIEAVVDSFTMQGYQYKNLAINGTLTQDEFQGEFYIRDPAVDFTFDGFVNFSEGLPQYKFQAIVNHLDLYQLNLLKQPVQIAGILDLDIKGKDLLNMEGIARIIKLEVTPENGKKLTSESLTIKLDRSTPKFNKLTLDSDLANASIAGDFLIPELPDIFYSRMEALFPEIARKFNLLPKPETILKSQNLTFQIQDNGLDSLIRLFVPKLPTWSKATVDGKLNIKDTLTTLKAEFDHFFIKDLSFVNLNIDLNASGQYVDLEVKNGLLDIAKTSLENINVNLSRKASDYLLDVQIDEQFPYGTHLSSQFFINEAGFNFRLLQDSLVFVNELWTVPENNRIIIDKQFLDLTELAFQSKEYSIELKDYLNKGLILHILDLDLQKFNDYIKYEPIAFGGILDVDLYIRDLFAFKNLGVLLHSDDLIINNDHFGELTGLMAWPNLDRPIEFDLEMDQNGERLMLQGSWSKPKEGEDYLDATLKTERFPLSIAEYFLDKALVNTLGSFDANVHLTGPLKKLDLLGFVDIQDVSTVVDYLGVNFSVPKGRIAVNSYLFDATGITLYDPLGNPARVTGGMTHNHLKDWGLSCRVVSDQFMALKTTKQQNPNYYGTALGSLDVDFSGSLAATNITVKCKTAKGTSLSIPVNQGGEQHIIEFVNFYNPEESESSSNTINAAPKGLQLELIMEVTSDAQVQIIFDERAGDILNGYGNGNIRLFIPRNGSLQMYGDYIIDRGDYLFTFQGLVNKSFSVERGGTIQWSGDPFDAQININTIYNISGASPYNLIADFFQAGALNFEQEARRPTEVNLIMTLTGQLLEPEIGFDIAFPRLFGEVRSLVESKMLQLRRDPNSMYWQAFGLIVANNFLPPNLSTSQGTEYVATINTVSEMISNQFSRYLTVLMHDLVADIGIISDVDFNFKYNIYQNNSPNQIEEAFTDSDFKVSQRINFYDDRLSLNIQGSVINTKGIESSGAILLGGDFQVEYSLTEDRRLRLRVYQRSEPTILGNNRYKAGVGITYRKEWD